MLNDAYQIVQNDSGKYALIVDGKTVAEYTRKADAKRGYARLCVKQGERADAQTDSRTAAAGCAAAQTPPTSNTGGLAAQGVVSEQYSQVVMVGGKLKEIPLRRGVSTSAHIDTLTFTVREDVFLDKHEWELSEDAKKALLAERISSTFFSLMGFGLFEEKNGINGYKYSYRMGTDYANYGFAAFGGKRQRDSICIHFSGEGLTAANNGWETRLYNWLSVFAPYARITRIDLAHDFLNGEYTPDQAYQDWKLGLFQAKHTNPRARLHGYDWLDNQRTGKTFYVGTTNSSRMVRVYDKGCEQGDYSSQWVRFELQMRNRDYVIPHDILIKAGEYLNGAYPVCEQLFTKYRHDISKAERISQIETISLEHCLKYASMQASPCINVLEYLGFDAQEIVTLLKGGKQTFPKRLRAEKLDCQYADVQYIHQMKQLAKQSDIYINDYMYQLHQKEQQINRQKYFDRIEQDALLYRMQQNYQPHYLDFMEKM